MPRNKQVRRVRGNGSGPSRGPRTTLLKKFQSTEQVKLEAATSNYAYHASYRTPDITLAQGAQAQFAAYELWRLKKIKVSIQAGKAGGSPGTQNVINSVANTVVWTAADYGANESATGQQIMQYQNAKRNTLNLNRWTYIIDTPCRINSSLGKVSLSDSAFIMPNNLWVNTTEFISTFYSGYQLFIQDFASRDIAVDKVPEYTLVTEYFVEFMQPAFQNTPSSFATRAFAIRMVTLPDAGDLTITRPYVFQYYRAEKENDELVLKIHMVREDGQPGSLTYTAGELREAITSGTSGKYFGGRRATYDGPLPPLQPPTLEYLFGDLPDV